MCCKHTLVLTQYAITDRLSLLKGEVFIMVMATQVKSYFCQPVSYYYGYGLELLLQ